MKRSILCILAVTLAMFAGASPVMPEQAKQIAQAWAWKNSVFGERVVASGDAVPFTNEVTTLWYQVQMTDGSCLIVSPVTELEPVIAALEDVDAVKGLPEAHPMLAMLTHDMIDRLRKLDLYKPARSAGGPTLMGAAPSGEDAAPSDPVLAAWAERSKAKWTRLLPKSGPQLLAAKEDGIPDPIARQIGIVDGFEKGGRYTHWDQGAGGGGYCYNYHTPNHAVCGCVATAMAAMMQYFAVTGCVTGATCPRGLIRETQDGIVGATYNKGGAGTYRTLGGTYDWSILDGKTDREGYDSLTDEQRELLGRVAYDAGVAVAMAWSPGESSAYEHDIPSALRNVFGFKDARFVPDPTEDQYDKLIYHQCWAGAPVGLGIHKENGQSGHSVLAVGYGEDDDGIPRVRIFTGWGGSGDGWYALPYITTASVPGGASHNFDVIDCVVTMIGYDTDETVPVVGHMDAPGKAIEIQGTGRTIYSNENGYFGTRVSPGMTVTFACDGKTAEVAVSADAAVAEGQYQADGDALCVALPESIDFILLNSSVAYSFAQAKALALAEGKAILRVSGETGNEVTTALIDYIYALDKENEGGFTNKFVYFFSSSKSSNPDLPDGNPSLGVFLPSDAEQSGRWQYVNGRLSYGYGYSAKLEQTVTNDYEVAEEDAHYTVTNEAYVATWGQYGTDLYVATSLPYTVESLVGEMVPLVLDNGWAEFCRRTHGIVLTVAPSTEAAGEPDPTFGVHENTYTNGQEITALAPAGLVTNDAKTVISEFGAWTLTVTNVVAGGEETVKSGTGAEAVFTLASNDVATLVWNLEPKSMWISITDEDDGLDVCRTSPGSGWYPYGETVTFTATPGDGFAFDQWASGTGDDLPYYLVSFRRQQAISFRVAEPLSLIAYYSVGEPQSEKVSGDSQTLTVGSAELDEYGYMYPLDHANLPTADLTLYPAGTSQQVSMGGNVELPAETSATVSIAKGSFTDEFDVEWKCVGWMLLDSETLAVLAEGNGTITSKFVLDASTTLYWLWESPETVKPDDPDDPLDPADPPEGPDGGSPLTIYPNADGTLTVKAEIGNAVKGWWYVLRTAETVSGEYVPAEAVAANDVCVKQADEADEAGTLVLQSTFTPTEEKRFYKVSVEEEEP